MHDDLSSLPALRDVIANHDLSPRKSLGQNFLFDLNLTGRIARSAGPLDNAVVIEVGPGPGGLTRALLAHGAAKVVGIEHDARFLPALHEIAVCVSDRLQILNLDALGADFEFLSKGYSTCHIVANLPYNIATPLLIGWISDATWPPWWQSITVMVQREVVNRLTASPGSKNYGRLSVLAGWRTSAKRLFDVPASAFVPPPKVISSIVQFLPLETPATCNIQMLEKVTAAAFGKRRKMLRSSLKTIHSKPDELLEQLDIASSLRAEDLEISQFVAIANAIEA